MGKISVFRFSSPPLDSFSRMKYSGIHRKEPVRTKMVCHSLKKEEEKKTVKKTGHKNQDRKAVFHRIPQSSITPSSGSEDWKAFLEQSCRGCEWRSTDKSHVLLLDRSDLPGLKMQEPRHSLE